MSLASFLLPFQTLQTLGKVVSLLRMGPGWAAVVCLFDADSASRALVLNGLWAKQPMRPGIRVSPWNKTRPLPKDSHGEQFIGSKEHRRMSRNTENEPNLGGQPSLARAPQHNEHPAPAIPAADPPAPIRRPTRGQLGPASNPIPSCRPVMERPGAASAGPFSQINFRTAWLLRLQGSEGRRPSKQRNLERS